MKNWIWLSLFTIASLCANAQHEIDQTPQNGTAYAKAWQQIDSLTDLGLVQDAHALTDSILQLAAGKHQAADHLLALVRKNTLRSAFTEEKSSDWIAALEASLEDGYFPFTPMAHTLLATYYGMYYTDRSWQINNIERTSGRPSKSMNEWNREVFYDTILFHLDAALADAERLQQVPSGSMQPFLVARGADSASLSLRPTLYDFVIGEALDIYEKMPMSLAEFSGYDFLEEPWLIDSADRFRSHSLPKDKRGPLWLAVERLQEVLMHHSYDGNPSSYVHWDLTRIEFMTRMAGIENINELAAQRFAEISETYRDWPISVDADLQLAIYHESLAGRYMLDPSDANRWERKQAYEICEQAIQRHPRSYEAERCKAFQKSLERHTLHWSAGELFTFRKTPVHLTFRSVDSVWVRIYQVDFKSSLRRAYQENQKEKLATLSPDTMYLMTLDDEGDMMEHHAEMALPALERGYYIIGLSTHEDFLHAESVGDFKGMWVSDLSIVTRAKDDHLEVRVMDAKSGKPIPGAEVETYDGKLDYDTGVMKWNRLRAFRTDANGIAKVHTAKNYGSVDIRVSVSAEEVYYEGVYFNDHHSSTYTTLNMVKDRSIYRPGQTMHFKGFVNEMRDRLPFVKQYEGLAELYDASGQKVDEQRVKTNEFGSFSGSFELPFGYTPGTWYIRFMDLVSGRHSFRVEEYKRPQFEVTLDQPESPFQLMDSVQVSGRAKAFSGAPISNAKVIYEVSRSVQVPWFWRYTQPRRYGIDHEVAQGETRTDASGNFDLSFLAEPDKSYPRESQVAFVYRVTAKVIDQNGETHEQTIPVVVGYVPLMLEVDVGEMLDNHRDTVLSVKLLNTAGKPVKGSVTYTMHKLKSPDHPFLEKGEQPNDLFLLSPETYKEEFPLYARYNEDDPKEWPVERIVATGSQPLEGEAELMLPGMSTWDQGYYRIEMIGRDEAGNEVKEERLVQVADFNSSSVPPYEAFRAVFSDTKAEPGQTVKIFVGTAFENCRIFYEVEPYDEPEISQWLNISAGQQVIELPIKESWRGGVAVRFTMVRHGRLFKGQQVIYVPYSNKQLQMELSTVRQPLVPGAEENWTVTIKDASGKPCEAELLVSMYDASLDQISSHHLTFKPYDLHRFKDHYWDLRHSGRYRIFSKSLPASHFTDFARPFYMFNPEGFNHDWAYMRSLKGQYDIVYTEDLEVGESVPMLMKADRVEVAGYGLMGAVAPEKKRIAELVEEEPEEPATPSARTNFNETAFFYPDLQPDAQGNATFSFTLPESLTKWKFSAIAHTKALEYANLQQVFEARKDVMIVPNVPRYLRTGDEVSLTAKVVNLSEGNLTTEVWIELPEDFDLQAGKTSLELQAGESKVVDWKVKVPAGRSSAEVKYYVRAGKHTDGEIHELAVLPREVRVFESVSLYHQGEGERTWNLDELASGKAFHDLQEAKFTLDYTSNPAWYVVMALPYLMEFPHECAEQTFNRFYANSLAKFIVDKNPEIKTEFAKWVQEQPELLTSMLEQNPELKQIQLSETPWASAAESEAEQRAQIAMLFDSKRMDREIKKSLEKLRELQSGSGGWPWFKGMQPSRYITQYIVAGVGRMRMLGVPEWEHQDLKRMTERALAYCDVQARQDLDRLKEKKADLELLHASSIHVQYVFARTLLGGKAKEAEAFQFYRNQLADHWNEFSPYMQGMTALALHYEAPARNPLVKDILESIVQRSVSKENMGRYWKKTGRYAWSFSGIEQQALLIWAFSTTPAYADQLKEMQRWLLNQKRTQSWGTTTATADACFAILITGGDQVLQDNPVTIELDGKTLSQDAGGLGYQKWSWTPAGEDQSFRQINVTSESGRISWGGAHLSYMANPAEVDAHSSGGLTLSRTLLRIGSGPDGSTAQSVDEAEVEVGDKIRVRMVVEADRDFQFVHLKDQRAVGFEPLEQLSGYRWDGGAGYYRSVKDASMNFFFDRLAKGRYVIEYEVFATLAGTLSNGLGSVQCMYAPEFTAHSEGQTVTVK